MVNRKSPFQMPEPERFITPSTALTQGMAAMNIILKCH